MAVNLRGSCCQPPWFMVSPSVVHLVNLRGSQCQFPWFTVSTSVVHRVNLRGSCRKEAVSLQITSRLLRG